MMKNKVKYFILATLLLIINVSCKSETSTKIDYDYWQSQAKLCMVREETSMEDVFHYEEIFLDDGSYAIKKVKNQGKMDLIKNEIVAYRLTSDGKVLITVFDDTYSTGFISKRDFETKFSTDVDEMTEFGDMAFVKNETEIYDEDFNVIRTIEGSNLASIPLGEILERGDEYYKISFNPDGSWQVFVKIEDLKYDGVVEADNSYGFKL